MRSEKPGTTSVEPDLEKGPAPLTIKDIDEVTIKGEVNEKTSAAMIETQE